MGRGLPQEVIERAKKEVSLNDKFCFECKRCGRCCFRCEIVLTPYDILRLCHGLRMTTGEFLHRYAQITLGPESGLPILWLDFEKVQRWRGGDEQSPPCPFLALKGDHFVCGVYPYRPSCCRSFPVFRMAKADEEPKFYLQEVSCPAAETTREYTVAEWIGHEGLAPYHRGNQQFLAQVMALAEAKTEWPEWFLNILAGLWYDFSNIRKAKRLPKKFTLAMEAAEFTIKAMLEAKERSKDGIVQGGAG